MSASATTNAQDGKDIAMTTISSKTEEHGSSNVSNNTGENDGERTGEDEEDDQLPGGAQYPTGLRLWLTMLTVAVIIVLINLDMNIVATAVPSITDHFHTVADVGWYSAAFRLTLCAFQIVFGKIFTLYSIKRTLLAVNVIFLLGSVLCATATSSVMFVVGRAITGVAAAGLNSGSIMVVVQSTPLKSRAMWLSWWGAIEGLSVLCGPLLGGVITEYAGWRWCFYINLPTGAITAVLALFTIHEVPKPDDIANLSQKEKLLRLDILSNLIFIPAMISFFLALTWGGINKYAWGSGRIIGLFVTAGVLFLAFIFNQFRRGDRAALPPRIVRQRSVTAGLIWMVCSNSASNVLEYYLPTYFQTVRGYTPAQSGYLLLPIIILATIGVIVGGIGISESGYYTPFMLASSVLMPVAAGLVSTYGPGTNIGKLIGYTALWGLAYGIGMGCPSMAVQTVLSADDVPLGVACILFAQSFGPACFVTISQVLFTSQLSTNLHSVPGLNLTDSNGLTDFVAAMPASQKGKALAGIAQSLVQVWYLVVGLACASIIGAALMEWHSVKSEEKKNQ